MNSQNAFVARTAGMRTFLALAFIIALFAVDSLRGPELFKQGSA